MHKKSDFFKNLKDKKVEKKKGIDVGPSEDAKQAMIAKASKDKKK